MARFAAVQVTEGGICSKVENEHRRAAALSRVMLSRYDYRVALEWASQCVSMRVFDKKLFLSFTYEV